MSVEKGELRMSLWEHLGELRQRLFRVLLAVLVFGALSLVFSEEIFRFLARPILDALPEGQRTLIQTSAVEELGTFFKVGLYAGLFLSMPVLLHQLWGFVSPGLYAHERRMALPFVVAGTACFVAGAVFCYSVVLPPAFRFLLEPEGIRERQEELAYAQGTLEDAGLLLRAGDVPAAARLLARAEPTLSRAKAASEDRQTLLGRIDGLAPALDAADRAVARTGGGREALSEAILARNEARTHALEGRLRDAATALDRAVERTSAAFAQALGGEQGELAAQVVRQHAEAARKLVSAHVRLAADDWTRPMLSMREQLNLLLVLLLAFGVIFEIPVVVALLAAIGLVDGTELARARRYAIVANVVLAAIITPTGDPFNLALMAVPMMLCYEIGILAAKAISRRRRAREQAALAS